MNNELSEMELGKELAELCGFTKLYTRYYRSLKFHKNLYTNLTTHFDAIAEVEQIVIQEGLGERYKDLAWMSVSKEAEQFYSKRFRLMTMSARQKAEILREVLQERK